MRHVFSYLRSKATVNMILPSKEKCATVRHIHGHSRFETSSSLTHEPALGLSLHGLIEAKYDHVEHPHLDNDISREKREQGRTN